MYRSVAIGDHSITVRGTGRDNQSSEINLQITVRSIFTVNATYSVLGTVITVNNIISNQNATFECQLDDQNFTECKHQAAILAC